MITVKCFEDITLYHYALVEAGTQSDVLHMKVIVDDALYNYYQYANQYANCVIVSDSVINLKDVHSIIPLHNHLELLEQSKKNFEYHTKVHGIQVSSKYPKMHVKFVDIRRSLKLKQLFKNDRYRDIIKTYD